MSAKVPPKPSKETIYIDVDDEITGIIDKVENAGSKVVALVLPKRAASLQSIVNMKLLKRSADTAAKNVVLITNEAALLPLAGAAGLHVAKNLQSPPEIPNSPRPIAKVSAAAAAEETAEVPEEETDAADLPKKYDYGKPIGALAAAHEADNPETIDLEDEDEEKPKAAAAAGDVKTAKNKVKVPNFDRFRMMLGLGVLGIVALIVFIILALFVLPKATITIHTTSEPVSANFNLNASTGTSSIDPSGGNIPAQLESSDQTASQSVTATGQQNNGQKATGNITFSIPCADVSGSPPTVPAGTGVSTSGLTYITQSSTSLTNPSFSGGCHFTGSTNISAINPGSKYNIGDSTFTVSGSDFSNVTGNGSASGGSDNIVTVLSQSDVDNVKNQLTSGNTASTFTTAFENKLASQGEYVFTSTLKAGDPNISASPSVGQPASTANVTVKITYTVLAVKKSDLQTIIQDKLNSQIDKTKQKLSDSFLSDASITVQSQPSPNSATLLVNEDTTAVPIINIETVKKTAEGSKAGDIQAAIGAWAGVKSVDVNLSPFWVSKAPKKDGKVKVVLIEDKSSPSNSAP